MNKWISMGLVSAMMFAAISCEKQEDMKKKGSRKGSKNTAQSEQIVDVESASRASK